MTYTKSTIQEFLSTIAPFDKLSPAALAKFADRCQLLRYRMGQAVLVRDKMPAQLNIVYEGQMRLLGYDPRTQRPITLKLMRPGDVLGWVGLVRGIPCETAIASIESICLVIPALDFLTMLEAEPQVAAYYRNRCSLIEAFDLLGEEIHRRADGDANLKDLAQTVQESAVVCNLPPGITPLTQLERDRLWLVSGGGAIANQPVASRLSLNGVADPQVEVTGTIPARVIGFSEAALVSQQPTRNGTTRNGTTRGDTVTEAIVEVVDDDGIPFAPDRPVEPDAAILPYFGKGENAKYPFIRGRGDLDSAM
ncbi:MAG TPA: cyclic nucleotide-binding domain-containing protein, partial [Chroococcidiopsis sp.]